MPSSLPPDPTPLSPVSRDCTRPACGPAGKQPAPGRFRRAWPSSAAALLPTELATAYADFGADVKLIARSGLLTALEPFGGVLVAHALRQQGVTMRLDTKTRRVTRSADGVVVRVAYGIEIGPEEMLAATGRSPVPPTSAWRRSV